MRYYKIYKKKKKKKFILSFIKNLCQLWNFGATLENDIREKNWWKLPNYKGEKI